MNRIIKHCQRHRILYGLLILLAVLVIGILLYVIATKDNVHEPQMEESHPYSGKNSVAVKPTNVPLEIDGIKDDVYEEVGTKISLDEYNLNYYSEPPLNEDATAYLTYDKEFLYVYVEITDTHIDDRDPLIKLKDHVSVLIDFNYTRARVEYVNLFSNKVGYLSVACDNDYQLKHAYTEQQYANEIMYYSVVDKSNNQYAIEMRLPFIDEFEGTFLGFEIMNTDCLDGVVRGVRTWNVDGSQMEKYTHCLGTLKLEENLWIEQ